MEWEKGDDGQYISRYADEASHRPRMQMKTLLKLMWAQKRPTPSGFVPPRSSWYRRARVIGSWDDADKFQIRGWCFDPKASERFLRIELRLGGRKVIEGLYGHARPDVSRTFGVGAFSGFYLPLYSRETRARLKKILTDSAVSDEANILIDMELFVYAAEPRIKPPLKFLPPGGFVASKSREAWRAYFDLTAAADRAVQILSSTFERFARIEASFDIVEARNGMLRVNEDSQIYFSLSPEAKNLRCIDLKLGLKSAAFAEIDPVLSIDYGAGHSEANAFNMREADDGWSASIPFCAMVKTIRLRLAACAGYIKINGAAMTLTPDAIVLESVEDKYRRIFAEANETLANFCVFEWQFERSTTREGRPEHSAQTLAATEASKKLNDNPSASQIRYRWWVAQYDTLTRDDLQVMRSFASKMPRRPFFSVVMPTFNSDPALLTAAINSILAQTYTNFEICIADDASKEASTRDCVRQIANLDRRVKYVFRETNGHISECSNSALAMVSGDYVVLVDHDDVIPAHALWVVAYYLNVHPDAKILYSDEDKLGADEERCEPYFKGCVDRYLMYGHNAINHLGVYATDLVYAVGGFQKGYEGSQDYDLFLRCADNCREQDIVHIPHILYHWRKAPGSAAAAVDHKNYAIVAAKKALDDHFARTHLPYLSVVEPTCSHTAVAIASSAHAALPSIAVIISVSVSLEELGACLAAIEMAGDQPTEIFLIGGDAGISNKHAFLESRQYDKPRLRLLYHDGALNSSALNNIAARESQSDILCFLGGQPEVLSFGWLARASAHFEASDLGAVGAKIIDTNGRVQHFGIYLGLGLHKVAGLPHYGIPGDAPGAFAKASLIQQFSAATAQCLFVRRSVFEMIGGFDEGLEAAYYDVDLCLRIRQAGYKIICDPGLLLRNKGSAVYGFEDSSDYSGHLDKDVAWMRSKWGKALDDDPFYNPNLDLMSNNLALSFPPRNTFPWKTPWPW